MGHSQKIKTRIEKFKETRGSRFIHRSELDKACFQHDIAYGDFKDLQIRIASDKVLCNKAFVIASSSQYGRYQRGLTSMVFKFFDKKVGNLVKILSLK